MFDVRPERWLIGISVIGYYFHPWILKFREFSKSQTVVGPLKSTVLKVEAAGAVINFREIETFYGKDKLYSN